MSTLKRFGSISLALLLVASYSVSDAQAQRRGMSSSMGRSMGSPGLSRSSGLSRSPSLSRSSSLSRSPSLSRSSSLSRGLSRSSISPRAAGPSTFRAGPSPGLSSPSRSYSPSRSFGSSRYSSRGLYGSSIYSSRRPSSGLSISIGSGLSPRYGSSGFGRGYGLGYSYPYSSPYASSFGGYNSGFGYSPYYYSARPSIGLSIYSTPSYYSQPYSQRYPSTSSSYRYTQPVSPYTSSPYQSYRESSPAFTPQYDLQPRDNPYTSSQPERASGDPSDPRTELRAGMVLPDGSRVISVGALPEAGAANPQPTQLTPAQPVPVEIPAPVETTGPSVLQKAPAETAPMPVPAEIEPAEAPDFEELPAGNVSKAEDV